MSSAHDEDEDERPPRPQNTLPFRDATIPFVDSAARVMENLQKWTLENHGPDVTPAAAAVRTMLDNYEDEAIIRLAYNIGDRPVPGYGRDPEAREAKRRKWTAMARQRLEAKPGESALPLAMRSAVYGSPHPEIGPVVVAAMGVLVATDELRRAMDEGNDPHRIALLTMATVCHLLMGTQASVDEFNAIVPPSLP